MKILSIAKAYVIGASIGIFGICSIATAGDITNSVNGPWLAFIWYVPPGDAGSGEGCAISGNATRADDPPWTFVAGENGATVKIVDYAAGGDQYELWDNGESVGVTSGEDVSCGLDPDICFETEGVNRGVFELDSGPHELDIKTIDSPYGVGCGYFRVDATGFAIEVDIDIQPTRTNNNVRPNSSGLIPVAILNTDAFNTEDVDIDTVSFGPWGAIEVHSRDHAKDVDGDGDKDLLFHFRISETGIVCEDTEATLKGRTKDGVEFSGTDSINTVKCGSRDENQYKNGLM
jgi:hypothetical protein